MGTQGRERRADGSCRVGARKGDGGGRSWGPVEAGHVVRYAGGNKDQGFLLKRDLVRAGGPGQVRRSVSSTRGEVTLEPLAQASFPVCFWLST